MKRVITSFSCSLLQAQAINNATKHVKNRSAWIVEAIMDKIKRIDKTNEALDNATVAELLSALHYQGAITQETRWMIQERWDKTPDSGSAGS